MNMSTIPPQYDDAINMLAPKYDPNFTAEISSRMRVPDKIALIAGSPVSSTTDGVPLVETSGHRRSHMQVPDKITIAEDETALVKQMRPLPRLDDPTVRGPVAATLDYIGLSTPPRVLTVNSHVLDEDDQSEHLHGSHMVTVQTNLIQSGVRHRDSHDLNGTLLVDEEEGDDLTVMKRNMLKLHSRLQRLEEQSAWRGTRDTFIHTLLLGYFVYKVIAFFARET